MLLMTKKNDGFMQRAQTISKKWLHAVVVSIGYNLSPIELYGKFVQFIKGYGTI